VDEDLKRVPLRSAHCAGPSRSESRWRAPLKLGGADLARLAAGRAEKQFRPIVRAVPRGLPARLVLTLRNRIGASRVLPKARVTRRHTPQTCRNRMTKPLSAYRMSALGRGRVTGAADGTKRKRGTMIWMLHGFA